MKPSGLLLIVLGVFIVARTVIRDSNGETLAGRLSGGQPSALTGSNAVGTTVAEGTVTSSIGRTMIPKGSPEPAAPIITSKGGGALNARQLTFANTLAKLTGLNIATVKGWVLSEEPASATVAPNGPNNWLNIGDTGSGNYAGGNPAWRSPVTAAEVTAGWLKGGSLPGYGPPSSGIQAILGTAKQSISKQVAAIQNSGWAASHYPNLPAVVSEFR